VKEPKKDQLHGRVGRVSFDALTRTGQMRYKGGEEAGLGLLARKNGPFKDVLENVAEIHTSEELIKKQNTQQEK